MTYYARDHADAASAAAQEAGRLDARQDGDYIRTLSAIAQAHSAAAIALAVTTTSFSTRRLGAIRETHRAPNLPERFLERWDLFWTRRRVMRLYSSAPEPKRGVLTGREVR